MPRSRSTGLCSLRHQFLASSSTVFKSARQRASAPMCGALSFYCTAAHVVSSFAVSLFATCTVSFRGAVLLSLAAGQCCSSQQPTVDKTKIKRLVRYKERAGDEPAPPEKMPWMVRTGRIKLARGANNPYTGRPWKERDLFVTKYVGPHSHARIHTHIHTHTHTHPRTRKHTLTRACQLADTAA